MIRIVAYCALNPGDDLFVRTLVRRYPETQFRLRAHPSFSSPFLRELNLHIDNSLSYNAYRAANKISPKLGDCFTGIQMAHADAVVRIGGSIYIELPGYVKKKYKETNPNVFILGANFGPYRTEKFLKARREQLSTVSDCCFRDRYSYELLRDISTVRYAPDILFGYPYLPEPVDGDRIGVSVIDFTGREGLEPLTEAYESGVASICDYWTEKGKTVELFSFCEAEGDGRAADRIISSCSRPELLSRVIYRGDPDSLLDALNRCEIIYATRFHAMILGWTMHKTVIPLIYSQKQRNVIGDIGFSGAVWDISRGEKLGREVLCADTVGLDDALLRQLREGALAQFSALDAFIHTLSETAD